jgi:hypothetical protein
VNRGVNGEFDRDHGAFGLACGQFAQRVADLVGVPLMFAAHRGIDPGAVFEEKSGRWLKE